MSSPFLSIVIPAHNEENRLPETLLQISRFVENQSYLIEVLVVENGSQDRTLQVAQDFAAHAPYLRIFHEKGRGKGQAVRKGMLEASGEFRFICDADLSMPLDEINRFLPPVLSGYDIAIASREARGAVRYGEPFHRHLIGRIFNSMVRLLVLPGLHDTQCGFKCFRGEVANAIFPLQTLNGMSFDAEVLYIARRRGYRIIEVPIPWYFNADSRVRLFDDSLHMALDLINIRQNARRGLYGPKV